MEQSEEISKIELAKILVEDIVDLNQPDSRLFINGCGIDSSDLDNSDEIWKAFVRYNIDAGGIKSSIVYKYWNNTTEVALIKQRERLIDNIELLKGWECYSNFTYFCPVTYKSGNFVNVDKCHNPAFFDECPVINLIKELKWHKAHYRIAKLLAEDAKRLLIDDIFGKKKRNLNDVVTGILEKYPNDAQGKAAATTELLNKFLDMKGYGTPPKVITWFLSELSSPVHQVNHWPGLDYNQLNPVDVHVKRLMVRFGFIDNNEVSNINISNKLFEFYPDEPRKLDFALYRFGGESEYNICGKIPKCELCKEQYHRIFENCSSEDKIIRF